MLVIGITGGVGAGKSSVLQALREHCSCKIVLADDVGNKVKEPGQKCYTKIVELLGKDILKQDLTIDKLKMSEKIFSNTELLEQVNQIIHPAVEEYILNEIQTEREKQQVTVFFLEAALLIEAGYVPYLDELWYIFTKKDVRINRLKESRGYSEERIEQIMSSQLSETDFLKYADVVLDNSYEFGQTFEQIKTECMRLNIWEEIPWKQEQT